MHVFLENIQLSFPLKSSPNSLQHSIRWSKLTHNVMVKAWVGVGSSCFQLFDHTNCWFCGVTVDPRHSPGKMMQAHRLLSCLTETVCYYHSSSREHCFAAQELFCLSVLTYEWRQAEELRFRQTPNELICLLCTWVKPQQNNEAFTRGLSCLVEMRSWSFIWECGFLLNCLVMTEHCCFRAVSTKSRSQQPLTKESSEHFNW